MAIFVQALGEVEIESKIPVSPVPITARQITIILITVFT